MGSILFELEIELYKLNHIGNLQIMNLLIETALLPMHPPT